MPAVVDKDKCAGVCRICIQECPAEAITVDDIASIDPEACIECGFCAKACPEGAITIQK